MTTSTHTPTYAQVREMVFALPYNDVLRLREDIEEAWVGTRRGAHSYLPPFGPATAEEAISRAEEAVVEYKAGHYVDADEFDKSLEEKYPWLAE